MSIHHCKCREEMALHGFTWCILRFDHHWYTVQTSTLLSYPKMLWNHQLQNLFSIPIACGY
jgi:hypothetical protein